MGAGEGDLDDPNQSRRSARSRRSRAQTPERVFFVLRSLWFVIVTNSTSKIISGLRRRWALTAVLSFASRRTNRNVATNLDHAPPTIGRMVWDPTQYADRSKRLAIWRVPRNRTIIIVWVRVGIKVLWGSSSFQFKINFMIKFKIILKPNNNEKTKVVIRRSRTTVQS